VRESAWLAATELRGKASDCLIECSVCTTTAEEIKKVLAERAV
jgi:hypothetical protein